MCCISSVSGRRILDRVSVGKGVNSSLLPGRVRLTTSKIGVWFSIESDSVNVKPPPFCMLDRRVVGGVAYTRKLKYHFAGCGNLIYKDRITLFSFLWLCHIHSDIDLVGAIGPPRQLILYFR